jgi:hypothetical protein
VTPNLEAATDFHGFTRIKQKDKSFVIPSQLTARNLLLAGSETADFSRDNAVLRNNNGLHTFFDWFEFPVAYGPKRAGVPALHSSQI